MKLFFKEQFSKIAWRRVFIISFVWTVFAMQSQQFRNYKYDATGAIAYGVTHGGMAMIILSVVGAASTKNVKSGKDIES
tara:strand:+ start:253 stop:489 length:237 start_codon:yes stop_codon:yes gene_type:complete